MRIQRIIPMAVLALGLTALSSASAQTWMPRAVVTPGGGHTSSATTAMDLTLGQPVVGTASSTTTRGQFGFWLNTTVLSSVDLAEAGAGSIMALNIAPNPVTESGSIEVTLAQSGPVEISLYDMQGRQSRMLFAGSHEAGRLSIPIDARALANGTYFVAVSVPGGMVQHPLTVVR
jgi:hypothetical protein